MNTGDTHALDVRDHLDRALHGLARQPRRLDRDPRDPRRISARRSRSSSGPSTPTRSRSPSSSSPAPRSATASAAGACSRSASAIFTAARPRPRSHRSSRLLIAARAVQGLGGAIVTPLTLTHPQRRRARREARPRARRLGRASAGSRSRSARSSAARSSRASRGSGSSGSTSRSGSCSLPLALLRSARATGPTRRSTSRASGWPARACSGSSGAWSAGTARAGRARRSSARSSSARSSSRRSSPGSCGRRSRCCRCGSSATARSPPRTSRRCSCSSGCSARSSCSPSSSRPCRATRRSRPGLRILPWTLDADVRRPVAGALSDRIGGRPLIWRPGSRCRRSGSAWIASVSTPTVAVRVARRPVHPLGRRDGAVLRPGRERRPLGRAAGARRARPRVRTTRSASSAACFGVAVLASVFARYGGYESPQTFVDGLVPALWVGAAVLALGSVVSLLIPRKRRSEAVPVVESDGELVPKLEAA